MEEFKDEWLETMLREALTEEPAPSQQTLAFSVGLARMLPQSDRPSLIARLITGGQALATVRGGEAQQRLYETDGHLITLWDEVDSGASRYLIGQVYEKGRGPLVPESVTLFSAQHADRGAQQEGSEFHMAGVVPGVYALRCALASTDILLPGVEVGA